MEQPNPTEPQHFIRLRNAGLNWAERHLICVHDFNAITALARLGVWCSGELTGAQNAQTGELFDIIRLPASFQSTFPRLRRRSFSSQHGRRTILLRSIAPVSSV
jgi:hypothetical protein